MQAQTSHAGDDAVQVQRCREGEPEALATLRQKHHGALTSILLARGASQTETEDLLADLWADCVPGDLEHPSLLEKFSGKCTVQGWLATVATNRWLDLKRKQARRPEAVPAERDGPDPLELESLPAPTAWASEEPLVELLRASLQAAFSLCPPTALLVLRLVYLHGLSQREVMRMLGWSESKVSRFLSRAMQDIETHTLRELKQRDPWLELSWQDFVALCETHQVGFL
jgi:RNA polymerase sigma factor (sigma-70 family)